MDVLKKINKMRLDRKWSVYRLSLESGIPQSTITNMFNRETLPSIPTLKNLCDAFGVTMSDFFKEENEVSSQAKNNDDLLVLFNQLSDKEQKSLILLLQAITRK